MKIQCIVIDDEPIARKGLAEYIADTDFLELAGEFDNPMKATSIIGGERQLLFLDIQMPVIDGMSFLKTISQPPPVIFTTAYPDFAIEGYEMNALDYLLKPIAFPRFLKAVNMARDFFEVRQRNDVDASSGDYFFVKVDGRAVRVNLDDILFVEALQNYVVIHTKEKKYMTYLTFRAVEEYLLVTRFIKVHKSYIVAAACVDGIEGSDLLVGGKQIPVSRTLKDEVIDRLTKDRFLRR